MDLPPGIPDNQSNDTENPVDNQEVQSSKEEDACLHEEDLVSKQQDDSISATAPSISTKEQDTNTDDAIPTLLPHENSNETGEKQEDFSNIDISKFDVRKEEVDEIFDIFTLYDRNGDGFITESDLMTVIESMQKYKPTKEEVRRAIRAMIPHHEGDKVDFPSFLWYKLHDRQLREKSANSKDIIEAFRHFDKDNDGFWGIEDLRYMFNQIDVIRTEDQLSETLREVDVDGDGKISFEDFRKTMTTFIPNSLKELNLKGLSWRRHSTLM